MNILVTGGAGFIGSHVVKALLQRGYGVTVVDDLRHGLRENVLGTVKMLEFARTHGVHRVIFASSAAVYGERKNIDDEGGVINVFTRRVANELALPIYGDGTQSRDYIYVGDIVQLLSHEKAKRLLSWEPHMSLENGLRRLYAYYRDEP